MLCANLIKFVFFGMLAAGLAACSPSSAPADSTAGLSNDQGQQHTLEEPVPASEASISKLGFGTSSQGRAVFIYTLTNIKGMSAEILNYGGIIRSLTAPDRDGVLQNVVLGFDTLEEYEAESPYFGALIGRFGNRIAHGKFSLGGDEYELAVNNGPNHLHGGDRGFDKVVWDAEPVVTEDGPSLSLKYVSENGEEGYPGTLVAEVRYTLTNDNEIRIEYTATSDKPTPVNLTHHSYFNLSGDAKRDILEHHLEIAAHYFTPVDSTLIPTGEYRPVEGTPFDFRSAKAVGEDIDTDNEQIRIAGGYDHNWIVHQDANSRMKHIATLSDPESGRVMKTYSTEPGLQFYSGNFLDGTLTGKGVMFGRRYGLCLETQHFPDSPNQPDFPSTILQPGEIYKTQTIYSFSTD